jgi:hypothetical protein
MRLLLALLAAITFSTATADPLPSWNDGPAKQAIMTFVTDVTNAGGPDFVPPAQRIAVFDNDGTLWVEQPMYTQLAFVLDRVKALAPEHPEWQEQHARFTRWVELRGGKAPCAEPWTLVADKTAIDAEEVEWDGDLFLLVEK